VIKFLVTLVLLFGLANPVHGQLCEEITLDPLGRGYSGMTNEQVAVDLNTAYRTRERITMSAGEIMEAIDGTEFAALSTADRVRVDRVLGLGAEVIIGPGNNHNAVQELLVFGGGSVTVANLVALRDVAITRAAELSIRRPKVGHVEDARGPC